MSFPPAPQFGDSILFAKPSVSEKSFTTSQGKVIKLRRKTRRDDVAVTWKHDESYGIDINKLLDLVEASKDQKSVISRPGSKQRHQSILWTEKWRPKTFFDLVGNERTNRRVLKWLRQWSPLVFGETLPKAPSTNWHSKNDTISEDPLLRPNKRILLINGPPGIGKTSVAHIVAKQAGYSVVEINASDERAGPRVRDKVYNALFNHTFDNKPVCLIADEIDGSVENGFVKVLIDIVNHDYKATQRLISEGSLKGKRKGRKKSFNLLTRPIITVCNNIYVSALDKLKPHCEIVTFNRPVENALLDRLEQVCRKENLRLDKKALKEITELAQGDIRNCLNSLQFLASNDCSDPSFTSDKDDQSKDTSLSWYRICNKIFKRDPHVDTRHQFKSLLRHVEANSNFEKIIQGCFTLYPDVKYSDNGVNKPSMLSDWLYFNDRMFNSLFEHNGDLIRYSAVVPMVFFQHFSDIANKEDLRIKTNDYELRERQKSIADLLKLICARIPIGARVYMDRESLIQEILPLLDYIIAPDIGKIRNIQLKQTILNSVVAAIEGLGLGFGETNEAEVANVICIDPPFHKISILDEKRLKEVIIKRPALLNLILAKVQESKVKKRTVSRVLKENENASVANKRQKTSKGSNSNPIEFFKSQYGTMQKKPDNQSVEEANADNTSENVRIWVQYNEGFSNAVRKNVTWSSLWQ
ncbi:LAFE_0F07822g1_1 [Lachancea fermentati]|uniref:LAFE_0F07822g1_1 n=1 Tax=Lachancea fermentati TaxID=4955 RepID=A0A1G4MFI0_LACFM|nr:LAFE_0F07822g1_1 [Lachancea fermentati]